MKKHFIKSVLCLSIFSVMFFASTSATLADTAAKSGDTAAKQVATETGKLTNPLKANSIVELINNAIDIFVFVAILAAVLMLIWTGLQYILARGDAKKIGELSQRMMWIIVGIAIILGSKLMVQIIIGTLESSKAVDSKVIQGAKNIIK